MHAPNTSGEPAQAGGSLHSGQKIQRFFASIASRYDLANHVLSVGCDFLWRRKTAQVVASYQPETILDLATGSGDLAVDLRRAVPAAYIIGADFCPPMLQEAQRKGVPNLVAADGLRLPFAAEVFDVVTIGFGLRNMESWGKALGEIARVLRPGGRLLILDFSVPAPPLRWLYRPYLHHVLPAIASVVTRQKEVYQYLADSIEAFPSGREMERLLAAAGLQCERQIPLQGGIVTLHVGRKAAAASVG